MSGYVEGILVLLAINVVFAYGAFLPIAAGQLNLGIAGFGAIGGYVSAYLSNNVAIPARVGLGWTWSRMENRLAASASDRLVSSRQIRASSSDALAASMA